MLVRTALYLAPWITSERIEKGAMCSYRTGPEWWVGFGSETTFQT